MESLAQALFRPKEKGQPYVGDLRYQLLTAVAGTLAFADAQRASTAVLVVHDFVTNSTNAANHVRNGGDYNEFLVRLSERRLPEVAGLYLDGPFTVPGGELFPGGRTLYIGKITTVRRRQPMPARVLTFGSSANLDAAVIPRFGGEVHALGTAVAAVPATEGQAASPFLAIRRIGHSRWIVRGRRGLSETMESPVR